MMSKSNIKNGKNLRYNPYNPSRGVAQYNISDGDRISQYLHELNIRMIVFSPLKILRSGYICEILKNLLIIINLTRV